MKNRLSQLTIFLCLFGGNYTHTLPVGANELAVKQVTVAEAEGRTAPPVLVELPPGYGMTLSFIPSGDRIEKVWFDNPAFATLDVDGCLSGLGAAAGETSPSGCSSPGATVLHLRRINKLTVPGLPDTNRTLLTAVAVERASGRRRVYLFRVVPAPKTSYQIIEVVPSSASSSKTLANYRLLTDAATDWQVFQRGLDVALQQRSIVSRQPLFQRIQTFLLKVKNGERVASAAEAAGISLQLVERLRSLGSSEPIPVPPQPSQSPNAPSSATAAVKNTGL